MEGAVLYYIWHFRHKNIDKVKDTQYGAVLTGSIFFLILTTDTPLLTREGEIWGVFCE